jgi:tRNA A-37 threonylcarbamoyl transferase component Bud32
MVDGLSAKVDERATVVERDGIGSSRAIADCSGQVIEGRYRLVRKAGAGSMGDVYEGHDLVGDRRVAVKILKPEHAAREMFRHRFVREARSAAMIAHPNVVQVHEVGHTAQGLPYYVMEYLEGEDLRALLDREGRLPWESSREILMQVAGALAAAHAQGVVHRDIKPSNVLVWFDEGAAGAGRPHVKLLDFGVAKLRVDMVSKELTQAADVVGTVLYMAPEQAQGRPADARSDIYAFGVMGYELVTGEVPFSGTDIFEVMRQHLGVEPIPLRQLRPELPGHAEAFVLRCLAKAPEARFQSMHEALQVLGQARAVARTGPRTRTVRARPVDAGAHSPAGRDAGRAMVDPIAATMAASPDQLGRAHLETVRASVPDGGFDEAPTGYFRAGATGMTGMTSVAPAPPASNPMARSTMLTPVTSTMPMVTPSGGAPTSRWTSEVPVVRHRSPLATVLGVIFVVLVVASILIGIALVVLG